MDVTNWDVEKYKFNHESEEHWELRKKFLTKHRDKYPETKLLSLAQLFFNIELLGCRYPEKTMQLIAELSKGVADGYREKKKGKLKRTFAQASCPTIGNVKDVSETPVKVLRTDQNISTNSDFQHSCSKHSELIQQPPSEYSEFSRFVLYENCNSFGELETCPIRILLQSAEKNGFKESLTFCYPGDSRNSKDEKYCELRFAGKVLSSGTGKSKRIAKINAAVEGLNRLRKTCFTIQEKNVFLNQNLTCIKDGEITTIYPPIPQDNISSKMMQKMGCTGSGLGKQQQGMQSPIQISAKPKRKGSGHENKMSVKEKFKQFFSKYMANETRSELIIDSDVLSPDECQILQEANEKEDKRRNEDSMKDLFEEPIQDTCNNYDFDREEGEIISDEDTTDIVTTDNSKESKTCIICCRLNSITGEETKDDVYDIIWGTCCDNTGLTQVMQDNWKLKRLIFKKKANGELTDNEMCDMDVSDGIQESSDEETKSSLVQSAEHNRNTKVTAMPLTDLGSPLKEASNLNKICQSFPAPSVGVPLKFLNSNGILNQSTFPKENINSQDYLPVDVIEEDFNSVPKLSNIQIGYATHKIYYTGNKTSVPQVDSSTLKSNVSKPSNISINSKCDEVSSKNLVQTTENYLSTVQAQTVTPTSSINSSHCKVVNSTNHTDNTEQNKGNNDKIKIFLPDGSYKRISLECVKTNQELKDFVKYSPEKTGDQLKCMVTIEDLKSSRSLRKLFSDFLLPHLAISKTSTSPLSNNCLEINESKSGYGSDTGTLKNVSNDMENSSDKHIPLDALRDQGNLSPTQIIDCEQQKTLLDKPKTPQESCSAKQTLQESSSIKNNDITSRSLITQDNSHTNQSLNHLQTTFKNQYHSLPPHKSPNPNFRIFLPDGSFKRVTLEYIKSKKELREFTKYEPHKHVTDLNKHVTIEDLKTNKALQNLFADFLPSLQALKEDMVKENSSIETTDSTSDESMPSLNNKCSNMYSKNETNSACIKSCEKLDCANEKSSLSTVSTPTNCEDSLANDVTEYYNSNHVSDKDEKSAKLDVNRENIKSVSILENIISTNQLLENFTTNVNSPLKSQEKKIKLFLPNGSYKCVPLSNIECNKKLSEFTKYTHGKPLSELNNKITAEDLKSNESLREIYSDFLSTAIFKDTYDSKSNTPTKQFGQLMPSNINSTLNEVVPQDQICVGRSFSTESQGCISDSDIVLKSEKTIMIKQESSTNVLNESVNKDSGTGVVEDQALVLEGPVVESNPNSNSIGRLDHEFNQGKVNPTFVGQKALPLHAGGRKRGQPKIRFFLPDGSFKRVQVSIVQKHKELNRLVQLNHRNITLEHFNTIPGLRKVFPDFVNSYPLK